MAILDSGVIVLLKAYYGNRMAQLRVVNVALGVLVRANDTRLVEAESVAVSAYGGSQWSVL